MLTKFQLGWGVAQWVAFLKDKEIPVFAETRDRLTALCEEKEDQVSPKELTAIVFDDPFLVLKLLRRVEGRRSRTLGQETTTALASVLQAGVDDLLRTVRHSALADESLAAMKECAKRTVVAARIARAWAMTRADISPDEVALAALLAESGELLLWHFAAELPQKAIDELISGRALRTVQAQQQAVGFSFKQMTLELVEAWALPQLIALLIRGSDTLRANVARLAGDTARHIAVHPENPAIPADLVNIKNLIPATSHSVLIAPLPISAEYKERVLHAVAQGDYSRTAG